MDAAPGKPIDERAARLQLLAAVARQTTAIRSLEDLLQSAVFVIRDAFSYFLVNIFLVDGDDIAFRAGTGESLRHLVNSLRMRIGVDGITGWVAGHGVARNVPDVTRDPWYRWEMREELRTRSELAVPIAVEGRVTGVLDVQSERVNAFTDLDVVTQQAVADQLAVAIENARLYGELNQELCARRRRESLLRTLSDAGLAMLKAAAPGEVFAAMGGELGRAGFACALYLTDDPPREATLAWPSGGDAGRVARILGVPPEVSRLQIADVAAFRAIAGGEPALFVPPRSVVAALLTETENRLLGFAVVEGEGLAADDLPAIRVFALQAATAWRKAQLVQDLESSLEKLRHAQEQLLQAQKMEAVGRLAGGVAHDFNNLLTAILGYTEILLETVPPGEPLHEDIQGIRQAAHRAADLTRQLLAFSRKQVLQPRAVDCNALLDEARGMLRRMIGEDVRVETSYAPGGVLARADPSQMLQVIMNLAVNARDAMPAGGVLTLSTAFEPGGGQAADDLQPGGSAVIHVSDTGTGMDAETLSHLFEPFFTTKERGKGTGLGLSTAYGIVTQSGGSISCASEPGRGATFTIRLPATRETPPDEGRRDTVVPMPGRGETILVVEDDSAVRNLIRNTLEGHGYDVLIAADGQAGLALLRSAARHIDLLVTDLVLPGGVSGAELAREAHAAVGTSRVLCVSGYSAELPSGGEAWLSRGGFLQKPFGPTDLLRKVSDVLERS